MGRRDRARSFLFEPARFKNDEAVRMMSLEARGAYIVLFCELWDQPEPGIVPNDDRLLASLARATPEEWGRIAADVRRAFDAQERPGHLVQRGMMATIKAQDRYLASQSHAGHVAANARWSKEKDAARIRGASDTVCDSNAASVLGSRFGSENLESTHLSAGADVPVSVNGNGHPAAKPPTPRRRPESEPPGFADAYAYFPRKTARRAAAKAFAAALKRHPDCEPLDFVNAAKWYAERVEKESIEPRYIPHPATWWNQDRFLEEFGDEATPQD